MNRSKVKWAATQVKRESCLITPELYEAQIMSLTRVLFNFFANPTAKPNDSNPAQIDEQKLNEEPNERRAA